MHNTRINENKHNILCFLQIGGHPKYEEMFLVAHCRQKWLKTSWKCTVAGLHHSALGESITWVISQPPVLSTPSTIKKPSKQIVYDIQIENKQGILLVLSGAQASIILWN